MVQLDRKNKAPLVENDGDMFSFNPHDYRCCQHNVAFGWPYFAEHLWTATPKNGLAAALYAPCSLSAKVGRGTIVQITETTDYPFDDRISFAIATPRAVQFALELRVPAWCGAPEVAINGEFSSSMSSGKGGWVVIDRKWRNADRVELKLPMSISVRVWEKNKNAVSVDRGPLTYSLQIGERWQPYGGTDRWPAYELFATTPWNYGLIVNTGNPAASFEVVKRPGPLAYQPFTVDNAADILRAKGKRIPKWKQESNGLIQEIQQSPVRSEEPVEELSLIPMGCARLRVTAFPQIGECAGAK